MLSTSTSTKGKPEPADAPEWPIGAKSNGRSPPATWVILDVLQRSNGVAATCQIDVLIGPVLRIRGRSVHARPLKPGGFSYSPLINASAWGAGATNACCSGSGGCRSCDSATSFRQCRCSGCPITTPAAVEYRCDVTATPSR